MPRIKKKANEEEAIEKVEEEEKRHLPVVQSSQALDKKRYEKIGRLGCSFCAMGTECPEYHEGYVCSFEDHFKDHDVKDVNAILEGMQFIVNKNKERLYRAYVNEVYVGGGQLDVLVSRQSQVVLDQMRTLLEMQSQAKSAKVTVETELPIGEDGKVVGGGIISALFGGGGVKKSEDVPLNVVTVEEPQKET